MIKTEKLVALRSDNTPYREFPNQIAMDYWFYSIQGTALEKLFKPAKITTIIEVEHD